MVASDGTRVLGLGDIGPKASIPVMEGKALLFKYLGGVDAVPIVLDTKDPDKLVETVLMLQPAFGGVNLEDIAQPKCFDILEELRVHAEIPVWHDDQQGTASVILAGLINAARLADKEFKDLRVAFVGCGAANVASSRLIFAYGVDPAACVMVDIDGILGEHRIDIREKQAIFPHQWHLCEITNAEGRKGYIKEALRGMDAVIAASTPGPGVIKPDWIEDMAPDPIVFACANPVPEIWPWEAHEAGALVVATGRSDFFNQVNNSLGFPGIFRGALDVRARTITDEMAMAASETLAEMVVEDRRICPECILPSMEDWEVYPREAAVVAAKAVEQGIARIETTYEEEYARASKIIRDARAMTQTLMQEGLIPEAPEA
jgi:malate dehydrogenase (oxaloacetate-decarboxylating)